MILGISTVVLLLLLSWFFSKQIHKYRWYIYAVVFVVAIALFFQENITILGFIPFGAFLVVMYTGAIPKGTLRKRLAAVRSEYAIIGFLMLLPHGGHYFWLFLTEYGLDQTTLQTTFGSIAMVLMVPLFVTSFIEIRRKMTYKHWKRLHRLAYIIFGSIYLHLLLIQNERFYVYLVLGVIYFTLKLIGLGKYLKKRMS